MNDSDRIYMHVWLSDEDALALGIEPGVDTYVASYDPEAMDGYGSAGITTDKNEAMIFDSVTHAMAVRHAQPKARPFRLDGEPNRPLTHYTMSLEVVENDDGSQQSASVSMG